jgi:hypothetical protein
MRQRCENPSHEHFKYYGGNKTPVKVCERWSSFENFYEDMGDRPEGFSEVTERGTRQGDRR